MATSWTWSTTQWAGSSPKISLVVTQSSSSASSITYSWKLQYIASSAASSSADHAYSVTVKIGSGSTTTLKSGTYNISGKSGTYTIASGTKTVSKEHSAITVTWYASFAFNLTWSGSYAGTLNTGSHGISVAAKTSYSIKYNANGGTGGPTSSTKWHGETLALPTSKPTRTGHTFKNWNTKADGTGTTYASGANYTANSAVTLYAQWTKNTYTISYNVNGGTSGTAPSSQTKAYGVTLKLSSTVPTRTNYNFLGWATSSSGAVVYSPGDNYTANSAATLYAKWALKTYTVSYNVNGGIEGTAPAAQTKTHGTALTLSTIVPQKEDYNFLGWATSSSGAVVYSPGASYTANSAVTLYAVWEKGVKNPTFSNFVITRYSDAQRTIEDPTGSYGTVEFDWAVDASLETNWGVKITCTYGYSSTADGIFSQVTIIPLVVDTIPPMRYTEKHGSVNIHSIPPSTTMQVHFKLEDALGNVGNAAIDVAQAKMLIDFKGDDGVAIGKKATESNLFDVALPARFNNGISIVGGFTNKVLWSGALHMSASDTIQLSEAISAQNNGIVLVWSRYLPTDNTVHDDNWQYHFIPKYHVQVADGDGVSLFGWTSTPIWWIKYLYIYDTRITGNAHSVNNKTSNGLTYNSNYAVLRYVLGV